MMRNLLLPLVLIVMIVGCTNNNTDRDTEMADKNRKQPNNEQPAADDFDSYTNESAEQPIDTGLVFQIYHHLEKAIVLEVPFKQQNEAMEKLVQKEEQLYQQIINLSETDFEKMDQLSQQAIDVIYQQLEKLQLEKDSIETSKKEFDKIKPLIEDLDQDTYRKATSMVQAMENRYHNYQKLYDSHKMAIHLNKELYLMLPDENVRKEQVVSKITAINDAYNEIEVVEASFNHYTDLYNRLRRDFYKAVDLE